MQEENQQLKTVATFLLGVHYSGTRCYSCVIKSLFTPIFINFLLFFNENYERMNPMDYWSIMIRNYGRIQAGHVNQ